MVKASRMTEQKRIIDEIVFSRKKFFDSDEVFELAKKKDNKPKK
jgi:hypothetical protein